MLDDGETGAGASLAFQLITLGSDGWPHASMISVGEVVAIDDETLRLALWPRSHAAANCAAGGRALLLAVVDGVGYSIALSLSPRRPLPSRDHGSLSAFDARVSEVRADSAPYAELEGGIRFRLLDPGPVLARWAQTRRALLGADE